MRLKIVVCFSLILASSAWCQLPLSGCRTKLASAAIKNNDLLRGQNDSPLLLAFLPLTEKNAQASSRATAVILQSLERQYDNRGLRVVAIDASFVASRRTTRHADIVNTAADWSLSFPILEDPVGHGAQCFHVHMLPTVLLISPKGKEVGRWEGFTRTPVLAQAIEQIVGGPLASVSSSSLQPEGVSNKHLK